MRAVRTHFGHTLAILPVRSPLAVVVSLFGIKCQRGDSNSHEVSLTRF